MFDSVNTPAIDELCGFDPDDRAAPLHLSAVLVNMPKGRIRGLLADIIRFERNGEISASMQDVLRRAACHADASRIFDRLEVA